MLLNFIKYNFFFLISGISIKDPWNVQVCQEWAGLSLPPQGTVFDIPRGFQLFCFPQNPDYSVPSFPWVNPWIRICLSMQNGSCSSCFLLYLWIFIPKFPYSSCLCPGEKIGIQSMAHRGSQREFPSSRSAGGMRWGWSLQGRGTAGSWITGMALEWDPHGVSLMPRRSPGSVPWDGGAVVGIPIFLWEGKCDTRTRNGLKTNREKGMG